MGTLVCLAISVDFFHGDCLASTHGSNGLTSLLWRSCRLRCNYFSCVWHQLCLFGPIACATPSCVRGLFSHDVCCAKHWYFSRHYCSRVHTISATARPSPPISIILRSVAPYSSIHDPVLNQFGQWAIMTTGQWNMVNILEFDRSRNSFTINWFSHYQLMWQYFMLMCRLSIQVAHLVELRGV